jgi:hypothetical protein
MNEHLTEQQLIDYQFRLASDAGMAEARAHLDRCEACRQRLEGLKRKFAALDLLRDEIKPSEALISKTVEHAVKPRPVRVISLRRLPWLGATAAAVIVGIAVLLTSNRATYEQQKETAAMPPSPQSLAPARELGQADQLPGVAEKAPSAAMPLQQSLADSRATGGRVETESLARSAPVRAYGETPDRVTANVLEEKPPFAPASAIELVVLPRREGVQLTIYNAADLTLVREHRNLTLKQGWNWLQFMWADTLIDPTSLTLEPLERKDEVRVEQLVFPPRLRELGRWLIHSDVTGQVPFELTYFTSGLTWRAFYMGTLSQDEKTIHLEAYVRVNNASGEDYEDAQTRLVVGKVHLLDQIADLARRENAYGRPGGIAPKGGPRAEREMLTSMIEELRSPSAAEAGAVAPKEIIKQGLSEYFLYTVEGTETIPDKWGKRLLSFEASDIPVKGLCKYDEQRWGDQTIRFLSFANDEEHKLGETPLPDGMVRIYGGVDDKGHLSYVGGTDVKYIPVGEEVELNLGPARLVEVKPVLMDQREENHVFDPNGNLAGWDDVQTWKVEIANAGMLPVDIEITRGFDTAYWTLKSADAAVTYRKHDATHARFELTVEPRSRRAFEYTVTTYRGVRETTQYENIRR